MELDARKMRILQAIIDDYILTASPVGSRTIAKSTDIGLSSATIRNEMSDLEEMGFLEQPHTSAGRIPSDKAYRLYVDSIMRRSQLSRDELSFISEHYSKKLGEVDDIVNGAFTAAAYGKAEVHTLGRPWRREGAAAYRYRFRSYAGFTDTDPLRNGAE